MASELLQRQATGRWDASDKGNYNEGQTLLLKVQAKAEKLGEDIHDIWVWIHERAVT